MEFPLFVCNNCNFAEKENHILLKGYKIKQYNNPKKLDIKKEEYKTSSIDDNNSSSTNQLEIIEYPYNLEFNNEDDSLELNLKAAKMQLEKNLGMFNDDISNRSNQNLWEEGNYEGTNFKSITANNSSVIINNEDNISQNKILLKNLYSNYNNNNENNKKKNLIKKNGNKKVKGKKLKKLKKNSSNTKTLNKLSHENYNFTDKIGDKIFGIKVNYPCPDKEIEKFSLEEPKNINSDKKIKLKNLNTINLKKYQNSDNKINYFNHKKLDIINNENDNKNRKTINVESEMHLKDLKEKNYNYKISTVKIYSKFRERLFNDKINYVKKNTLTKYNDKKRIINKDIFRNKTNYRIKSGNKKMAQTANNNLLNTYNDNYRKLLLNRINKKSINYNKTLSNYSIRNYRYSNLFHFKKKNIITNLFMSKTYMNPFDKDKTNLYDFKITTKKSSKSKHNKQ